MTELERKAQEFDKEHDHGDGSVNTEHWTLFSDGARRGVVHWQGIGPQLVVPEPGSAEQTKWQIEFWTIRLETLVNQFEKLRKSARIAGSGHHRQKLAELRELQTAVRSARSKLNHLSVLQRGYTQADVSRAWEVWQEFSEAVAAESITKQRYDGLLLGKSSAGVLEKAKGKFDQAKRRASRAMEKWNSFEPQQARSIVAEQLDQEARNQREHELTEIEV